MGKVIHTVKYQYSSYRGEERVIADENDENEVIEAKLWAMLRRQGLLTLGMASTSARIVATEPTVDTEYYN